ncbi:MAG: hypothetical protein V3T84_14625 [Phycisphaerales bacterium]
MPNRARRMGVAVRRTVLIIPTQARRSIQSLIVTCGWGWVVIAAVDTVIAIAQGIWKNEDGQPVIDISPTLWLAIIAVSLFVGTLFAFHRLRIAHDRLLDTRKNDLERLKSILTGIGELKDRVEARSVIDVAGQHLMDAIDELEVFRDARFEPLRARIKVARDSAFRWQKDNQSIQEAVFTTFISWSRVDDDPTASGADIDLMYGITKFESHLSRRIGELERLLND